MQTLRNKGKAQRNTTMKISALKEVKEFTEYTLHSRPDWREVAENIERGSDDFEVDNVRFIRDSEIDKILAEELENDPYILGCSTAWFIADSTDIDRELIEALQDAEAYEALGNLIIKGCDMVNFANSYAVNADGYGRHFNHYDGGEEELNISGVTYLVFDNH
jgi:hypothetical protein